MEQNTSLKRETCYCPICGASVPEDKEVVSCSQILVEPMVILNNNIKRLQNAAEAARKCGNDGAEFAILEQIRLQCSTLSTMYKALNDY